MNQKMLSGSAAAVLAVTLTAPVFAGNKLAGIPLVWKPTEFKGTGVVNLTGITDVKIQIRPFVDTRADTAKFGENQQDAVFKPVTTSGSAADFCTRNFTNDQRLAPARHPEPGPGRGLPQGAGRAMNKRPGCPAR